MHGEVVDVITVCLSDWHVYMFAPLSGVLPNMFRNSIVNVSELVSYDLIKEQLVTRRLLRDAMPCHMLSAVCAGFVTTTIASPVDVVKTRIMNSAPGAYTSALSCARDMLQNEGAAAFYKGSVSLHCACLRHLL